MLVRYFTIVGNKCQANARLQYLEADVPSYLLPIGSALLIIRTLQSSGPEVWTQKLFIFIIV